MPSDVFEYMACVALGIVDIKVILVERALVRHTVIKSIRKSETGRSQSNFQPVIHLVSTSDTRKRRTCHL